MNLSTKQEQTHRHRALWLPRGRGGGAGMEWEIGVSRCKIYRMDKQQGPNVQHKELFQYPVINHNAKEYVQVCVTESFCCIAEINTTL